MFIDWDHSASSSSVRRSGIQPGLHHSESFRSSERSRRGLCWIYKHVTPGRGETRIMKEPGSTALKTGP
jgi:hypothetical protein